jgi:hypothetical protein
MLKCTKRYIQLPSMLFHMFKKLDIAYIKRYVWSKKQTDKKTSGVTSRLDITKQKICELEDIGIATFKMKQREKNSPKCENDIIEH